MPTKVVELLTREVMVVIKVAITKRTSSRIFINIRLMGEESRTTTVVLVLANNVNKLTRMIPPLRS
jgi:hypothetical protein